LPNNKNILLAAKAASELSAKEVAVVPTRTIPQGISAMLALDANGELATVEGAMARASNDVITGEITRATRSVTIDGVVVRDNDLIGLVDGSLCASGPELGPVVTTVLQGMAMEEREIVTVYYGADVSLEQAEELARQIEEEYPDVETEILAGGQAYYFFVLGAE
jgi:fatty acid kinase